MKIWIEIHIRRIYSSVSEESLIFAVRLPPGHRQVTSTSFQCYAVNNVMFWCLDDYVVSLGLTAYWNYLKNDQQSLYNLFTSIREQPAHSYLQTNELSSTGSHLKIYWRHDMDHNMIHTKICYLLIVNPIQNIRSWKVLICTVNEVTA